MTVFSKLMSLVYLFAEWFIRLLVLNILWMILTVIGLGVFGWLPATLTVIFILKKWLYEKSPNPSIKAYFRVYFKHLFKSQMLNAWIFAFCVIAYMDFYFFFKQSGVWFSLGIGFMLSICLTVAILLIYMLPLYSNPNVSLKVAFRLSLKLAFKHWARTGLTCLGLLLLFGLFYIRVDLLLCFGMSLTLLCMVKTTNTKDARID
jgi:uncharacterized membrane protein YesL